MLCFEWLASIVQHRWNTFIWIIKILIYGLYSIVVKCAWLDKNRFYFTDIKTSNVKRNGNVQNNGNCKTIVVNMNLKIKMFF